MGRDTVRPISTRCAGFFLFLLHKCRLSLVTVDLSEKHRFTLKTKQNKKPKTKTKTKTNKQKQKQNKTKQKKKQRTKKQTNK